MPFRQIKSLLFNYFHFNKQERNGVFVLSCIIAVLFGIRLLMPFVLNRQNNVQLVNISVSQENTVTEKEGSETANNENIPVPEKTPSAELFVFNPNTISEEDAIRLGFSRKLSATLINFRNKGGKFYQPDDLKKLYGLPPALFDELEEYILIPHENREFKKDTVYSKTITEKKQSLKPLKPLLEINTADSLSIVYLKGIGPGFTKRIIKYRMLLGGFHSITQLKEIYGMTDSLFLILSSQIQLNTANIIKIPINAVDFNTLKKHPYFNFQAAQAIINYRTKHGNLSETDIINSGIFNKEKLELILPYLTY